MITVTSVRLRTMSKSLYFDPGTLNPQIGDFVVVETERGTEMGINVSVPFQIAEEDLPAPLKPVVRIATDEDLALADELGKKSEEALPIFKEMAANSGLEMKPVAVEYLLSGDKAVFYFVAEERVDFREFVRELAARFHVRIDMRQIGVRDEARMVGGYSQCGQELCCTRFGGEFSPVSIRMAKEQDFPLNPLKISGVCGRLMCCLRYEFEAYKDFKGRAPKKGALIETPNGLAKVCDLDVPRELVTMRFEDGKSFTVPLGKMECPKGKEDCRPSCVSQDVFNEYLDRVVTISSEFTQNYSGELLDGEASNQTSVTDSQIEEHETRRPRQRKKAEKTIESQQSAKKQQVVKPRKEKSQKPAKRRPGDGQRRRAASDITKDETATAPIRTATSDGRRMRRRHTKEGSTSASESKSNE